MFRRLPTRLGYAFRGLGLAFRLDQAFLEHLICACGVIIAGVVLRVSLIEACLLTLCIAAVIAGEMFNTAIEQMAKTIDSEQNPQLGAALDISAAGVLVASLGAAAVGGAIFVYRIGIPMEWWTPGA